MSELDAIKQLAKDDEDISLVMEIFSLADELYINSLISMGVIKKNQSFDDSSTRIQITADPSLALTITDSGEIINVT